VFIPPPNSNADGGVPYYSGATTDTYFGYAAINVGDLDGDGRDDFAVDLDLGNSGAVRVFLSTAPAVDIVGPNAGSLFGWAIAGGDFNGDGHNDIAICAPGTDTTSAGGGVNGGALYLYYGGVAATGIRTDTQSADPTLPSITPDLALLGASGANFCWLVTLAKFHLAGTTDLAVGSSTQVYGFYGGSSRFGSSKVLLDLTTTGASNHPNFTLQRNSDAVNFPLAMVAADVDGDGVKEVVVSDNLSDSGLGQVYVYKGGAGLTGVIGAPATSPPELINTLVFNSFSSGYSNFGQVMMAVPHPVPGDAGDWLLVQAVYGTSGSQGQVVVFQGSSKASPPGIVIPGGATGFPLPLESDYTELDATDWSGHNIAYFGGAMGNVGSFDGAASTDILIGPGLATGAVVLYSFDATKTAWVKRAILQNADGSDSGFGTNVLGIGNFLNKPTPHSPQVAVVGGGSAVTPPQIFLWY